ncbi:hypothetical protein F220043C3_09680 [Enterocloster asparagiformis]
MCYILDNSEWREGLGGWDACGLYGGASRHSWLSILRWNVTGRLRAMEELLWTAERFVPDELLKAMHMGGSKIHFNGHGVGMDYFT